MSKDLILLPLFGMVLLTIIVSVRMYLVRVREMRQQRIRPQDLATRTNAAATLKNVSAAENFMNLFEMPVLFYVLVLLLYITDSVSWLYFILASMFVIFRYAHSFIHITYNRVMHRFFAYVASTLVLWIMWGWFFVQFIGRL